MVDPQHPKEIRFKGEIDETGRGHLIVDDEETAEALEGAFLDWVSRGYFELYNIDKDGHFVWRLTNYGKEHSNDIIRVKE